MGLFHSKCNSEMRLDGKTAVITGSNTGIGRETAKDFYIRGAKVIMACRNVNKAKQAVADIKYECNDKNNLGNLDIIHLDLSSIKSIKDCALKLTIKAAYIDILVNNAGVFSCPLLHTKDGFEMQIGTNHLGHFLFTLLLLPKIVESPAARIINVSSMTHSSGKINFKDLNWDTRSYSPFAAYCQSKLANILFTKELAQRLNDAAITNVKTYTLHPGVIKTEITRHLDDSFFRGAEFIYLFVGRAFMKTPVQGAQTIIHCAVSEEVAEDSGLYYVECKAKSCSSEGSDPIAAKKLWLESLKLVNLPENYDPFIQPDLLYVRP